MQFPSDLYYTRDHEWVRFEGEEALVGITEYAQQAMGDIVFVELPIAGDDYVKGEALANIESVKAVSEVFTPVTGRVIAINETLEKSPELLNSNPYGAWIARLSVKEVGDLLSADAYQAQL